MRTMRGLERRTSPNCLEERFGKRSRGSKLQKLENPILNGAAARGKRGGKFKTAYAKKGRKRKRSRKYQPFPGEQVVCRRRMYIVAGIMEMPTDTSSHPVHLAFCIADADTRTATKSPPIYGTVSAALYRYLFAFLSRRPRSTR